MNDTLTARIRKAHKELTQAYRTCNIRKVKRASAKLDRLTRQADTPRLLAYVE